MSVADHSANDDGTHGRAIISDRVDDLDIRALDT